jgi:serine/threonine protein kinase
MTATARRRAVETTSERVLAELVEEFVARREGGEAINPNGFAENYPEHAEALLSLLPALEVMADLSRSAQANDEPGSPGAENSGRCLGVLGDFRILREVGRGGMGVVYEAEQVSLNRRVALKVLPFAAAMDSQQLRRFKTEAQAAAQLHHTHIVPVHSVGCERGVHYYAMQFIEGQTLAQAIAERRAVEEPPPTWSESPRPSPERGEGGPEGRMRGEPNQPRPGSSDPSPPRGEGGPQGRMRGGQDLAGRGSSDPSPPRGEGGPQGRMRGVRDLIRRGFSLASDRVGEGGPQGRMGGEHVGTEGLPLESHLRAESGPPLESRLQAETGPAKAGTPTPTADGRSPAFDASFEPPPPPPTVRSATPTPSSRTREYCQKAAALGIQAAEALDHAHKVGIVHRDVKPANLLLDVQGNIWITDFGLARLQDDTGLTITGDLLGTLRYMSPEQALAKRGYLDHRTDIYPLGATLYELVTLRPAVEGQDRQEILRKIAQDEPIPPRQINPSIQRELETILLKAMNKEPGSRYTTAQELADDLRRFMDHKPIRARRPTVLERAAKWSRRHPSVMASCAVVLVVTVAGLSLGSVLLARKQLEVTRQRDRANELAQQASSQRASAQQHARLARQAVDEMFTEVAEKWLADRPRLELVQREFLEKALRYYEEYLRPNGARK